MICPEIDALFFSLCLKIFKSEFLIQGLISRLIVKKHVSVYQNLSLGVATRKNQSLKIEAMAIVYGSLNTLRFFTHLVLVNIFGNS